MKKNKQFVKKLKARSKKNSLSEKMLGDNVFCLKNTIVKIEKERAKMQGDHPFTDMTGEQPAVDKK